MPLETFSVERLRHAALTCVFGFGVSLVAAAQVTLDPPFPDLDERVTILYDAKQGNAALADCGCGVYLHTGVITTESSSPTDWRFVATTWGVENPAWRMTPVPNEEDVYRATITIEDFYDLPAGTEVLSLAFVFRNGDGSVVGRAADGADIYYELAPSGGAYAVRLLDPANDLVAEAGEPIRILAAATAATDELRVLVDGALALSYAGDLLDTVLVAAAGGHRVEVVGLPEAGGAPDTTGFGYFGTASLSPIALPAGVSLGYNDLGGGRSGFYLYAPLKQRAVLKGAWHGYDLEGATQMTPLTDGTGFYVETATPDPAEAIYQYLVDGVTIADPFSELILSPFDDSFIAESTFPGIPRFAAGQHPGFATWLRPKVPFAWQHDGYERPAEGELVIYELLIRDFVAAHDYATVLDSLDYLQRLGVNAIELLPVNEFEGNSSWGYNPSYHMALDKYYGPPEDFKALVDAAHSRGIAVIVDVVFNHGFGLSPYVQLYSRERAAAPDGVGPFFNQAARHPFNVGTDANHESPYTKRYVGHILRYLIDEYHVDGFRFDLSKGFTQTDYGSDVGAWSNYDAGRIAILKGYQDTIRSADPASYVILEHFATGSEERELVESGMFVWGNMNHTFAEAAMGYPDNDLYGVTPASRGFDSDRLVGYMESHDEERIHFKVQEFGNESAGYSTKAYPTSLRRIELISQFFYASPGARMLWQFGELGYDVPIDFNGRTGEKPIRWDFLDEDARRRLYRVTANLVALRRDHAVFREGQHNLPEGLRRGMQKALTIDGDEFDVALVGNFDVEAAQVGVTFPSTALYHDYWTGETYDVSTGSRTRSLTLAPGEYRLYTSVPLPAPDGGYLSAGGLSPKPATATLTLSPNPSSESATLRVADWPTTQLLRVEVLDATGRLVQVASVPGNGELQIPVSNLTAGSYRVVVSDEVGRTWVGALAVE